jgi:hypothetical protein
VTSFSLFLFFSFLVDSANLKRWGSKDVLSANLHKRYEAEKFDDQRFAANACKISEASQKANGLFQE